MTKTPKIIDRIRKLFALAKDKSASENEIFVAMEKASKLMLEYGVTEADIATKSGLDFCYSPPFNGTPHAPSLARAAALLYGVIPVTDRRTKQIVFAGPVEFAAAAAVTFEELSDQVEALAKEMRPETIEPSRVAEYEERFLEVCSIRVLREAARIMDQFKTSEGSKNALVVQYDQITAASVAFATGDLGVEQENRALTLPEGPGATHGWRSGRFVRLQKQVG